MADSEGEMEACEGDAGERASFFEVHIRDGVGHVANPTPSRYLAPEPGPDAPPDWFVAYEKAVSQLAGAKVRRAHAARAREEAEANLAHALAEVRRQREIALGAHPDEPQAARRRELASQASLQTDQLELALRQEAHKHLALGVHAAEGRSVIAVAQAEAEWSGASRAWEERERAASAAVAAAEAEMRRAATHMELAVGAAEAEMSRDEAMALIQDLYRRELGAGARELSHGRGDEGGVNTGRRADEAGDERTRDAEPDLVRARARARARASQG